MRVQLSQAPLLFFDVDNDGDLDALSVHIFHIFFYENRGTPKYVILVPSVSLSTGAWGGRWSGQKGGRVRLPRARRPTPPGALSGE